MRPADGILLKAASLRPMACISGIFRLESGQPKMLVMSLPVGTLKRWGLNPPSVFHGRRTMGATGFDMVGLN